MEATATAPHCHPRPPTRRCLLHAGVGAVAAIAALVALSAQGGVQLVVAVPTDVLEDYHAFLKGRNPLELDHYGGPHTRRDVVEVVLLQQALQRGGLSQPVLLEALPNVARILREIESGHAVCSSTSYWREDVAPNSAHFLFSDALVEAGQFEAGLYTVPGNRQALAARTLADVRQLRALSNRSWTVDWRTLEQLGVQQLQHVAQWPSMSKMVEADRADFLLAPFQASADLSLVVGGVRLVPIPGIKVGLNGTRHFLVSRQHPAGRVLLQHLNAGLARLRQQGLIRQAYVQSGFFNPQVAQWTALRAAAR